LHECVSSESVFGFCVLCVFGSSVRVCVCLVPLCVCVCVCVFGYQYVHHIAVKDFF
jgi:hypothetical protein